MTCRAQISALAIAADAASLLEAVTHRSIPAAAGGAESEGVAKEKLRRHGCFVKLSVKLPALKVRF